MIELLFSKSILARSEYAERYFKYRKGGYFMIEIFKKRVKIGIETFLFDADDRAKT
jgi:hypothetical protein